LVKVTESERLKKALPFWGAAPVSSALPVMPALNLQMQTV
jgi:hypothetical protein